MPRKPKVSTSAAIAESAFQEDFGQLLQSQPRNGIRTQEDIRSQMDVSRMVSPVDAPSRKSTASPMQGVVQTAPMLKGQKDSSPSSGSPLSSLNHSSGSQDAQKLPHLSSMQPVGAASSEAIHNGGQLMPDSHDFPTSQQTTSTASEARTALSRSFDECKVVGEILFGDKDNESGADSDGITREFDCCFCDRCTTGQYTLDVARKIVSDYFGRNKTATKVIKNWLYACRKHYQRSSYQPVWQSFKYAFIESQLELIDQQQPGVLWTIQFVLEERRRLDAEYQQAAISGQAFNPDTPEYQRIDQEKPHELPIAVLHSLQPLCGTNKTKEDCYRMIYHAREQLDQEKCKHLAHFELIPQWDPKLYEQWVEESKQEQTAKDDAKKKRSTKSKSCNTKRKTTEPSDTDSEPPRKMPRRRAPVQVKNGEGSSRTRPRPGGANGKGGFRKA